MAEQSIRAAVAERRGEGNGQPGAEVARKPDPVWQVLEKMEPEIKKLLPDHITSRSWLRTVLTGLRTSEPLAELATTPRGRLSLYSALLEAARLGLVPFTDDAAIVVFGQGDRAEATFMPQYKGMIRCMLNTGLVEAVEAHLIHRGDEWDLTYGDGGRFYHKPLLRDPITNAPVPPSERGPADYAYCYVRLKDGGRSAVVLLSHEEAVYIRDTFSRSFNATEKKIREYEAKGWRTAGLIEGSVWHRDFNAKWIISCIRRIKDVPWSAELTPLFLAASRDDTDAIRPKAADEPLGDFGADADIVDGEIVGEAEVAVAEERRGPVSPQEPPAGRTHPTTKARAQSAGSRQERAGQEAK